MTSNALNPYESVCDRTGLLHIQFPAYEHSGKQEMMAHVPFSLQLRVSNS